MVCGSGERAHIDRRGDSQHHRAAYAAQFERQARGRDMLASSLDAGADTLGVDRQQFLILAHPEAEDLIAQATPETPAKLSLSWRRFVENHDLLRGTV